MKKKLIEVSMPLGRVLDPKERASLGPDGARRVGGINDASSREKSIRHGHPSTLHLWWARRPLAAARAVLFGQMVDDPSEYVDELLADPATRKAAEREMRQRHDVWTVAKARYEATSGPTKGGLAAPGPEPTLEECIADIEQERLFEIIRHLVQWENTTNEAVLGEAREEIRRSWRRTCAENADHPRAAELFNPEKLPAFHDPFAGGGAIPLEAQRLGLEAYASDLNPVAVLINKAMIEIPPKFAGRPPVNPEARRGLGTKTWTGAQGLAEDVRYYGQWMRDEAERRIGHLYPKVEVTAEMAVERPDLKPYVGRKVTVIAWLWARTVKSPNPAFASVDVPLASTFMLSTKPGKEAYVEPVIEGGSYRFTVKTGKPKDAEAAKNGTKLARGANFQCLMSGSPIPGEYIKAEGTAGRIGARLMAVVVEGDRARIFLPPAQEMENAALHANPEWQPETPIAPDKRSMFTPLYGLTEFGHLFTPRQLVALCAFSDLVQEAREKVDADASAAGRPDDTASLSDCSSGSRAYADAVGAYLAFAISKVADRGSTICTWFTERDSTRNTFARQAIPMTWDYAELNVLLDGTGSFRGAVEWTAESVEGVAASCGTFGGVSEQADATTQTLSMGKIVSTDPPYYDNIGYADLSEFFYVWLRRSLKPVFPSLFATLAVPRAEELVANPYRHGTKEKAESFFLSGMTRAMGRLAEQTHPAFPVTIYYAFKQAETGRTDGAISTGWETFLDAVVKAGFSVSGTWPMRTELSNRMIGSGTNALASSIVLVCRKRAADAPTVSRREFVNVLKAELPRALAKMQRANIAPVDLAQAAIGPGMAVYTRYAKVLDAQGQPLPVREALALINQTLDEALAEQEGDFDADSRWALTWFEANGFAEGVFGDAETLSKAKNTSVAGMVEAGIVASKAGKVRLLKPAELPADWDPATDKRLTAWEMVHHLVRVVEAGGETAAAALARTLGGSAETARELCYRLYTVCERKKRAAEALSYNALVQSWPEITRLAQEIGIAERAQTEMF